ncbi:MAG: glycosyltransferase [Acidimicrobiales bacterium]
MRLLPRPTPATLLRGGLLAVAAGRIARGARRAAPLRPTDHDGSSRSVTVVVPARDEAHRIEPCLRSLASSGVAVLVVDDGSTDGTRQVATEAGARVIDAGPLPPGWAGKARAVHVGLEAASTDVVISIDADCRVEPGFVAAVVDALGDRTLVTAGTAVDEAAGGGRAIHASMLATLLYRFGPPGVDPRRPSRAMANGQCMAFDRAAVLDAGGFTPVSASLVEDLALARHLTSSGHGVAFLDATPVITVEGYGGAAATMRGWGRSLALRDVSTIPSLVADLAVIWSTMALPLPRLLARRGDAIDVAALGLRIGVVAATAPAFRRRGVPLVVAPLADLPVAAWLTVNAVRPSKRWRGRDYG